jgi:transposase InsO family protein
MGRRGNPYDNAKAESFMKTLKVEAVYLMDYQTFEDDLRGTLRNFGLKVGMVGTVKFEARIKELVENLPDLAVLVEPLLIVRRALRQQVVILHRHLLAIVRRTRSRTLCSAVLAVTASANRF